MLGQMLAKTVFILGIVILVVGGIFLVSWEKVKWGKFELLPSSVVTVTGEARTQQASQLAQFTAGVTAINDNKDTAIAEVNDKIEALTAAVKAFGIDSADVQTQNINVYRNEETYYEDGRQKTRPGQWRVNNSIAIKLKKVERANELATLLTGSGATEVYGPNFSTEDTQAAETGLFEEAIANAQQKAEAVAKSTNRKLGKMLTVTEGGASSGVRPLAEGMGAGGGGGGMEPGSSTVTKTVTVTFELN